MEIYNFLAKLLELKPVSEPDGRRALIITVICNKRKTENRVT